MSAFRQALAGLITAGLAVATVAGSVVLAWAESGSPVDGGTAVALAGPSATLAIEFPTPLNPTFTPLSPTGTTEPTATPSDTEIPPTATAHDTPTLAPTPFQVLPTPCRPPSDWQPIQIQRGDTMFRIALQYGLTVPILQKSNCLASTRLYAGATLYVPGHVPTPVPCGPPPGWVFYTVKRGDNLFRLSLRYGVTLRALQQANCLSNPAGIYAGQQLFVPPVEANPPTGTLTPTPPPTPTWTWTPVPTSIPPADTPVPPTNTSAPPTNTPAPTLASTATSSATSVPPTATSTVTPSPTPSATPTPTPTGS